MNTKECIEGRRSIRKFTSQAVSEDVLKQIVTTASFAPSWKNTQVTRYIAVTDESVKNKIAEDIAPMWIGNTKIIQGTPVLLVVSMITGRSGFERDGSFSTSKGTHFQSFDAGIATEALCLAAYEQGLGTVIMGIFDEKKVAEAVSLPEGQEVAALIAIGYPDESPEAPKRKTAEDLLTFI
ncbi:MAG: nitroreductase family protein [Lachnospiraceae bacterium]|nr:nitroreductase family protein [Candidatus Merdinaster equi]